MTKTVCVITAADFRYGYDGRFAGVIGVAETPDEAMALADSVARDQVMRGLLYDYGPPVELAENLIDIRWKLLSTTAPSRHWISTAYFSKNLQSRWAGEIIAESPVMHVQEIPVGVVAQGLQNRWEAS